VPVPARCANPGRGVPFDRQHCHHRQRLFTIGSQFMKDHDYAADLGKYTTNVNQKAIDTIVRYCGIALRNVDSSLVAASSPDELATVRDGFAAKKLGLDREAAEAGINKVVERMKDERRKHRVTFYYLLAEATGTFDKLL